MPTKVLLAAPRGYCAGVERAVEAVERALGTHGPPVYVRKQIVHNAHVVVVFGPFPRMVERALEAYPSLRVISDREAPGAVVVGSSEEIRDALKRPDGPVRS